MIPIGISDFSSYNDGMKKSLLDKCYFMDKIDAEVIVDFGCANGELIKFMYALFPNITYIGYDLSEVMIEQATVNVGELKNVFFSTTWEAVEGFLNDSFKNSPKAIVLSSIIHEVYSYSNLIENDEFWHRMVFGGLFDYVVVRDMMPKRSINRVSEINDIKHIRKNADKCHLMDFENVWGSIEENKNLVHFLMKYRYNANWDREVLENYFPIFAERFLELIPDNYVIDYHETFVLPFTKRQIEKDFGIVLKDTTHLKCILRKII